MANQGIFGESEPSDEDYNKDDESNENSEHYPVEKDKYWSLSHELNQEIRDKGILSVSGEDLANDLDRLYMAIKEDQQIISEESNNILRNYPSLYNLLLSWHNNGLSNYITAVWYSTVDNLLTDAIEGADKDDYTFDIKPNKNFDVLIVKMACSFDGCGYSFRLKY